MLKYAATAREESLAPSAVPSPGQAGLVKGPFPGSVVSEGALSQ